jgi:hypothetical protein
MRTWNLTTCDKFAFTLWYYYGSPHQPFFRPLFILYTASLPFNKSTVMFIIVGSFIKSSILIQSTVSINICPITFVLLSQIHLWKSIWTVVLKVVKSCVLVMKITFIADMYWYNSSYGSDAHFINWNVWMLPCFSLLMGTSMVLESNLSVIGLQWYTN